LIGGSGEGLLLYLTACLDAQWLITIFVLGGGNVSPCHHLFQLHATNYMPLIREKAAYWNKFWAIWICHCGRFSVTPP